ncbi:twin-arginine translocase subunit TatC [Microbacterium trichothecenolyticum]|uniref:Sec-independent protein translocase protein TatC n=1 Tax=Microbacterium trichothecenolyticum TaxID=69370 RepID=A0ABU0TUB2_MICTR|nr:twin-arginine translocase subunit TatC [Microbacterium trichothecenolyticum]MDQ1123245.1 sec-independent protein translocase protein TatC [Microbacterium trichothecenolyticum]
MPLLSHLAELRRRVAVSAGAIVLAGIAGFALSDAVIAAAAAPLAHVQGPSLTGLNFTRLGEAFDLRFKIAMTLGIVFSAPVWIYQVWAFLVPGLTSRERRIGIIFVSTAVPLFLGGACFGWIVVPQIVALLAGFAPAGSTTMLTASQYFDFLMKLMIGVGVAFVSPLGIVALNAVGVLSAASIIRGWRIALVVIIIFSATVTPPSDMMSMALIALPLCLLYIASAAWAWAHDRRAARRARSVD